MIFYDQIIEAALDAGRPVAPAERATFAAYLRARFSKPAPDLVVGSAGTAAQFLMHERDTLFPGVPMLLTAIDARVVPRMALRPGDAVVAAHIDLRRVLHAILQVQPHTRRIAVVTGVSPIERFWRGELLREGAFLAGRVRFVWLDALSLEQMQARVATLPPNSVLFYGVLDVDAAGVPHERFEALDAGDFKSCLTQSCYQLPRMFIHAPATLRFLTDKFDGLSCGGAGERG